jgi:hypothetical protein
VWRTFLVRANFQWLRPLRKCRFFSSSPLPWPTDSQSKLSARGLNFGCHRESRHQEVELGGELESQSDCHPESLTISNIAHNSSHMSLAIRAFSCGMSFFSQGCLQPVSATRLVRIDGMLTETVHAYYCTGKCLCICCSFVDLITTIICTMQLPVP